MTQTGPFQGVRILDLSTMIAAPWAAGILADQGAEVIKVEEPSRGDAMRHVGHRAGDVSAPFFMANRGKRGLALDLREPRGRDALLRLAATADVLLHNSRPGVMERLGLGYDDVRKVREDIIYVSVTGFGDKGPLARKAAYDPIMQAFAGMASAQGLAGGEPALIRSIVSDKVTALMTAQAISAALYACKDGRGGQQVQVSMLAATAAFQWVELAGADAFVSPEVAPAPSPVERYRLYRFADGWAAVSAAADAAWLAMMRAFGVAEAENPRLQTFAGRMQNAEAAKHAMAAFQVRIAATPLAEGIARLEAMDVPCAPVQSLAELAAHPGVAEAEVFVETDDPVVGRVRQVRPPARFSATPAAVAGPAPRLGEHTAEVLAEIGLDGSL